MTSQIKNLTFHSLVDSCFNEDIKYNDKVDLGDLNYNIDEYFDFTSL